MKLAISGKGGVGKSTVAAVLALLMARRGMRVLAVDADPDANLAASLGISEEKQKQIVPISEQRTLIEERTGAKVRQYGQMFKLNPDVSDIAGTYGIQHEGVHLLVLGGTRRGGSGCACPENVLLRALVTDLVLHRGDTVILDMEAGIEHLGRATAQGVDTMIVVVEPGQRSLETARRVIEMAHDIGLTDIRFVANKVTGAGDERFIRDSLDGQKLLAVIPWSQRIIEADRENRSVLENLDTEIIRRFETIVDILTREHSSGQTAAA